MSAKPLHKGSMRESIGCDDENFSSPKESRLRAIRGGSFFFIKNIPHSDNSDCKGITLNNKKSKEFIDTDCLSSIALHPRGYCFVASIGAHFDSQCPERCNFINSTFLSSCKFSANRAKMQIYLRFSEVPPKFKPRSGLKIAQVDSKNAAQQIKFSASRVKIPNLYVEINNKGQHTGCQPLPHKFSGVQELRSADKVRDSEQMQVYLRFFSECSQSSTTELLIVSAMNATHITRSTVIASHLTLIVNQQKQRKCCAISHRSIVLCF